MTFEQETKEISDFLRMNCGCFSPSGILTNAAERLDAQTAVINGYAKEIEVLRAAMPDLNPAISWLKNGCDINEAIAELEIHRDRITKALSGQNQ